MPRSRSGEHPRYLPLGPSYRISTPRPLFPQCNFSRLALAFEINPEDDQILQNPLL
jgi:hypothetical protein